jgi:methionine synthase I (cobalamin-dependent)/5,10-methylenetetrahydrofolate reductase
MCVIVRVQWGGGRATGSGGSMRHPFLDQLQQGPLLADGAMGTMLYSRVPGTLSTHRCFDELNISHARLVQGIHSEYIAAGARVIETNSFGANRVKLGQYGLGDQVRKINRLAANIAREAREVSGQPIYVAGAVGPSGTPLALPEGSSAELRDLFREQADALIERGVDLIILETFVNLAELRQALLAIRNRTELPIVAQMSFAEDGHTMAGQSPARVATVLADLGADVIGANCSVGPAVTLDVIEEMAEALQREHSQVFLSAMPNAGLPTRVDNRFLYVSTPEYFGEYARHFVTAGVRLIGGCCGTTPRHIAAMAAALGSATAATVTGASGAAAPTGAAPLAPSASILTGQPPEEERILPPRGTPTPLQEKLQAGQFVLSAELDPPKGLNPTKILDGAVRFKNAGVDCINIADSPMARVRMSCLALARLMHDHFDLDTIIHFTTRDRNLMALQSELLGAHALGIRNILALTGDPLRAAEYPGATGVWDVDAIGLIRILKGMNEGHDAAGASLGRAASFFVGAALNLNMDDIAIDLPQEQSRRKLDAIGAGKGGSPLSEVELELARYQRKIEAGADFIMTQPIYDIAPLEQFLERVGRPPVPLILGVIPLYSSRHAEYLHNEVPGITIPQQVRDRMRAAGERGSEVGLELARELVLEAGKRHLIQGAYIMPSYGRYDLIEELIRSVRQELVASNAVSALTGQPAPLAHSGE